MAHIFLSLVGWHMFMSWLITFPRVFLLPPIQVNVRKMVGVIFCLLLQPLEYLSPQRLIMGQPVHPNRWIIFFICGVVLCHWFSIFPSSQVIVEWAHRALKSMLKQKSVGVGKTAKNLNFKNCVQNALIPIQLYFSESQAQLEDTQVLTKNLESVKWEGPFQLVTWGWGYACVSTGSGLQWYQSARMVWPALVAPASSSACWETRGRELVCFGLWVKHVLVLGLFCYSCLCSWSSTEKSYGSTVWKQKRGDVERGKMELSYRLWDVPHIEVCSWRGNVC